LLFLNKIWNLGIFAGLCRFFGFSLFVPANGGGVFGYLLPLFGGRAFGSGVASLGTTAKT
jgi:hypothetical protein